MDRVLTNKLKSFILESGMDLVGFAPVDALLGKAQLRLSADSDIYYNFDK